MRLLTGLCCVALIAGVAGAQVKVTQVSYTKWEGAWKLDNGRCEMVIVPQVGRVMSFALSGGRNVLWNNPALAGQTVPKDDNTWHNFGGDKVWPTQQDWWIKYTSRNGWPPPYSFDGVAQTAERIEGGVRMTSPQSPEFGTKTVREFVMDPTRPLVHVRQWFTKSEGKPVTMTLWTVTQVRTPDYALLPVEVAGGPKMLGPVVPERLKRGEGAASLQNDPTASQKIGAPPATRTNGDWVAGVFGHEMLVESRQRHEGIYPDGNCQAEVYTAPAKDGSYVELEMLSPMTDLHAGQTLRDDAVWQIVASADGQPLTREKAITAARSAHEEALRELNSGPAQPPEDAPKGR